jgi:vanillate O-demethylase monooxygenase subunit
MAAYLKNVWYVAARGEELDAAPLSRTLLGVRTVLYRTSTGAVAALQDRCPHRFAPLSMGRIMGDELECGYHGLRFNGAGACSHNPHGPIPPRAKVHAYPTLERYGYVWLWPGDPSRADPDLLPEFPFLADPERFTVTPGYLRVQSNYQLIVDNLLDLSHALFLHPHFAVPGQTVEQQLLAISTKTVAEGNTVTAWRTRVAVPPNAPTRDIFGFKADELVDSRSHMTWYPPALLSFDVGACLTGTPESGGLCIPQAHLITPETELTSHYFFAATRNLRRDDPQTGRKLFDMLDVAFRQQDEPMIEAVQRSMGETGDLDSLNPILLRTDGAPVMARRTLQRLIAAEKTAVPSESVTSPETARAVDVG